MVAGYDHERRQHDLFRMKAVGSPEKGVQGRIGFYSSKKNIFMSGIFKTVIQSSINRVCVVLCSMSHQYKCSVRIHVPEFICNYPDDRLVIFFCCEKRISENNTGKTVPALAHERLKRRSALSIDSFSLMRISDTVFPPSARSPHGDRLAQFVYIHTQNRKDIISNFRVNVNYFFP